VPDGAGPRFTTLIQASDGNLYGTTYQGGSADAGTVFELSKDSNGNFTVETILHSFLNSPDGELPTGGLIQASDGNLKQ
jgi:uncharacterized repeat protein (TIGR03803 family)